MSKNFVFLISAVCLISACTRGLGSGRGHLVISAPSAQALKEAQIKAALPTGRRACYGVNVTGTSLPNVTGTCSPTTGLVAGYLDPGQDINLTVPSGQTLNVDLYLYLEPSGQNSPCPTMGATFPVGQLKDTYLIGTASNITTNATQVTVAITAAFPANNQNITEQLAMPATCLIGSDTLLPASPFSLSVGGAKLLQNSQYNLRARVGSGYAEKILSNSQYTMIVR